MAGPPAPRVLLVHESDQPRPDLLEALSRLHNVEAVPLHAAGSAAPSDVLACVVDVDLNAAVSVRDLRARFSELGEGVARVFVLESFDRRAMIAGYGLGARDFLMRPLEGVQVQRVLGPLVNQKVQDRWMALSPLQASALKVSLKVFEDMHAKAQNGAALDVAEVSECGSAVISALRDTGLQEWLFALRDHHNYTFKHVMFVTGSLAAFGQALGFRQNDLQAIVSAGLLHDIGKARVPPEILNKPAKLDPAEWDIMRTHPRAGIEFLLQHANCPDDALDAVVHHHERLDGNGYPDRLTSAQIGDLTRLVSIGDVFSALIDKRAYKESMSGRAALDLMRGFDGQLDMSLVDAFAGVARSVD